MNLKKLKLHIAVALLGLLSSSPAWSQSGVSISTTGSSITTNFGISNLVVDNALTISGSTTITQASASISGGYQSGDALTYDAGSLPGGVTGNFNTSTGVLTFTGSASPSSYQALLRTVKISLSSSSAVARSVTFTLGDLVSYTNGHYYKFVSSSASWASAYTAASSVGNQYYGLTGYLATVTSAGENAFIKQVLASDGWIGASDDYSYINAATGTTTYSNQTNAEGHWYWVTGPEAGTNFSNGNNTPVVVSGKYMNWNSAEPNNSSLSEHYAQMIAATTGLWNDLPASSSIGYVIEYGGLAGDPTVQLSASRTINVKATSIDGTYSYNATAYHPKATAVVVDGSLTITAMNNITDARVTVSSNFNTGDVLGYTGGLPSGVTASYNSTTGVLSFTGTATPAQYQALFRTVTFSATTMPNVNREITFSLGSQVAYTNGHFYQFVTSSNVSWTSAKAAAAAMSYLGLPGYLATITSSDENTFITQKLASNGWIGASDEYSQINGATGASTYADQTASEGNWYWITGPEAGTYFSAGNGSPSAVSGRYNNWSTGEPNNSGSEHYAQIYASGSVGKWNDLNGSAQPGYVVEFGGLPTDPVVSLSSTSQIQVSTALPIEDINLEARNRNGQAELRWKTINERNVSRYEVERSSNGIDFQKTGSVPAVGTGDNSYSFGEAAPQSGSAYYRIKSVDADGSSAYSNIAILKSQSLAGEELSVHPNPAGNTITIRTDADGPSTIKCIDISGKLVFIRQADKREVMVDISGLLPGLYYLRLEKSNGETMVTPFSKN